jgi:hypothetical protein
MAIFGWDSVKQAEVYTREAQRKRLVRKAMHLVVPDENGMRPKVSHSAPLQVSHLKKK